MDISLILTTNYKGSEWTLEGEDYSGLTWLSETPKPTKAALEKQWAQVQHDVEIEEIKRQRQLAYMAESDPIFFEYHRDPAVKETTWREKVAEIQARYPYPEKAE
jgi:hypothetical protein